LQGNVERLASLEHLLVLRDGGFREARRVNVFRGLPEHFIGGFSVELCGGAIPQNVFAEAFGPGAFRERTDRQVVEEGAKQIPLVAHFEQGLVEIGDCPFLLRDVSRYHQQRERLALVVENRRLYRVEIPLTTRVT